MSLSTRTASAPHADSARAARATDAGFPFAPGWNARDLADAVPLRLFELIDFDALRELDAACANQPAARRAWAGSSAMREPSSFTRCALKRGANRTRPGAGRAGSPHSSCSVPCSMVCPRRAPVPANPVIAQANNANARSRFALISMPTFHSIASPMRSAPLVRCSGPAPAAP